MNLLELVLKTRLEVLTKLIPLYVLVGGIALVTLLAPVRGGAGARIGRIAFAPRRTVLIRLAAFAGGAGAGLVLAWILGDLVDIVGVRPTLITRMWIALGFGGVALGVVALVQQHRLRRLLAVLLVPAALLAAAFGVNVDVAAYPTLNALFHHVPVTRLDLRRISTTAVGLDRWRAPAHLARHGLLGSVTIPGRESRFRAGPAIVYLPPAALVAHPPLLPVVLSLSGQPGWTSDVFVQGGLSAVLDRYARAHHGVAPIVVSADQLGLPGNNPMCIDSRLGRVDTYLTRDVRSWVVEHLPAEASGWGVEGFSEGGTCAMQLLAGHPDLFVAALAIAAEAAPLDRGLANTVAEAYGSLADYNAATPEAVMRRHGPYPDHLAVIAWGGADDDYAQDAQILLAATRRAGMDVVAVESPDSAHDFNTVAFALRTGMPRITRFLMTRVPRRASHGATTRPSSRDAGRRA